jgi:hypothetical protein
MAATAKRFVQDERKLRELILYIANRCEPDVHFGAMKLNKILFYSDFYYYAYYGKPITGVEYMKQPLGPVPRRLVPVRDAMVSEGAIVIIKRRVSGVTRPQDRIVAVEEPDLSVFTAEEIDYVNRVIEFCEGKSGTDISNDTHQHPAWRVPRRLGDTIPYEYVFLSDEPVTDYEREHGKELIEQYGWSV